MDCSLSDFTTNTSNFWLCWWDFTAAVADSFFAVVRCFCPLGSAWLVVDSRQFKVISPRAGWNMLKPAQRLHIVVPLILALWMLHGTRVCERLPQAPSRQVGVSRPDMMTTVLRITLCTASKSWHVYLSARCGDIHEKPDNIIVILI